MVEQLEAALERHLLAAIQRGELPDDTDAYDLCSVLEEVAYEWRGEADVEEIAAEAVRRHVERRVEDEAAA